MDVLWPAEAIYEGTWSSGPPPEELEDFELMKEMGWTWDELQATPAYVRKFSWDFINARASAQETAAKRQEGKSRG
ncbi:hypothetical protein [Peterkaempfera griseoplana]|uniref:hypothetical protein n=1 Tax=Peterkaempfera griseoplana TaxID=66896 RepID=UPI0006E45DCA|nr:hypothetical protein [Peterkaempfera griseoplana]